MTDTFQQLVHICYGMERHRMLFASLSIGAGDSAGTSRLLSIALDVGHEQWTRKLCRVALLALEASARAKTPRVCAASLRAPSVELAAPSLAFDKSASASSLDARNGAFTAFAPFRICSQ